MNHDARDSILLQFTFRRAKYLAILYCLLRKIVLICATEVGFCHKLSTECSNREVYYLSV